MKKQSYILGLDIGTNSIGWAIIHNSNEPDDVSNKLVIGSRVFESVLDKTEIEKGQGQTKNVDRRNARQLRKQLDRRRRRKARIFSTLQQSQLLPDGNAEKVLPELDAEFRSKYFINKKIPAIEHTLSYYLRARALDERLELFELGRALYHLAQRRGFLSNRKNASNAEEDSGIKGEIHNLNENLKAENARTLGEYFSRIDPEIERIRQRHTSRQMYINEFELIWEKQSEYYPEVLTDDLKKRLSNDIFYQRPLRSVKHLIGQCSLEPKEKRAPYSCYEAQLFRTLSQVNNSSVLYGQTGEILELTAEHRKILLNELAKGDLSFSKAKQVLKLKRTDKFNYELGGEKRFIGNRIQETIMSVFGEEWFGMSEKQQLAIIEDIKSFEDKAALRKRGMKTWGLGKEQAEEFSDLVLEEGYCSLSRKAIQKMLPDMVGGMTYAEARKKHYPESFDAKQGYSVLPSVTSALSNLRNPVVERTLNELRKIVNSVIAEHGKPEAIRIELARDLRNSQKKRQEMSKTMDSRRKKREAVAKRIIEEAGIARPKRSDIERALLAEECGWTCPYTGKKISMTALFRDSAFDVEHIIPFSRCLDDSFANKTLCYHEENRNIKRNRTPYEAYHSSPDKWEDILKRVNDFEKEGGRNPKLQRFKMESIDDLEDFSQKQLVDTRYASRLAMEYLGLLYGGQSDQLNKRRIYAGNGRVTAFLRGLWGLNRILGDKEQKQRDDHRHHAIDAVVTALLSPRLIQQMSHSAEYAEGDPQAVWKRLFSKLEMPWDGFYDDVKEKVDDLTCSHRLRRKASGALHEETLYSNEKQSPDGSLHTHVRKRIDSLSVKDVGLIADARIRKVVQDKLTELGQTEPAKAFADPANHPVLHTPGRRIKETPIHKVRLRLNQKPIQIGKDKSTRNILPGNNHHIELYEVLDKEGQVTKWEGKVVSLLETRQRISNNLPIVERDHGKNTRFLFSLCGGDCILLKKANGSEQPYIIRGITQRSSGSVELSFVGINDARLKKEIENDDKARKLKGENKGFRTASPNALKDIGCRKILVTPLGQIRWAND